MKTPSNLPPGVTDRMIEEQQGQDLLELPVAVEDANGATVFGSAPVARWVHTARFGLLVLESAEHDEMCKENCEPEEHLVVTVVAKFY